jgi:hypothetical protein
MRGLLIVEHHPYDVCDKNFVPKYRRIGMNGLGGGIGIRVTAN